LAGEATARRPDVGGQAVIEGVMMRSPTSFTVVCRRPDGAIVIKEEAWRPVWADAGFLRRPLLRGGVVMFESLLNGISALTFSASVQAKAEAEAEASSAAVGGGSLPMHSLGAAAAAPQGGSHLATYGMVAVSLVFGLGLFVGAPHLLAWLLGTLLGFDSSSFVFHAVDGVIKLAILVGYMAAISLLPDIRRVFQYHGAEHKSIFTYEQGLPLTVENARLQTRFHPRCGTSFLLIVIMVSVVLFSAALTYRFSDSAVIDNLLKILIKVPLMFPVAGVAYELIKLAGKKCGTSRLARALSLPGMLLQRITTKEPDDSQLEVALISIRKTLWREQAIAAGAAPGDRGVEQYPSGADVDLPLVA
jgi:uncharacterized protein YqhQ